MRKKLLLKNNTYNQSVYHYIFLLLIFLAFVGCSSVTVQRDNARDVDIDISSVPDAIPKMETRSKYGNSESYVVFGKRYYVMDDNAGFTQRGIASWYGKKFHGKRTSNGETYDMYAMTAAHKTIILPAYVEVTNLDNGKKIIVKVNDRGPFHDNRIIDLSYSAAVKLDIIAKGTGLVEIRVVGLEYTSKQVPKNRNTPTKTYYPDRLPVDFYIQADDFSELNNAEK